MAQSVNGIQRPKDQRLHLKMDQLLVTATTKEALSYLISWARLLWNCKMGFSLNFLGHSCALKHSLCGLGLPSSPPSCVRRLAVPSPMARPHSVARRLQGSALRRAVRRFPIALLLGNTFLHYRHCRAVQTTFDLRLSDTVFSMIEVLHKRRQ